MMELVTARDAIPAQFEAFRTELDEHHDRRERLIKVNRIHFEFLLNELDKSICIC